MRLLTIFAMMPGAFAAAGCGGAGSASTGTGGAGGDGDGLGAGCVRGCYDQVGFAIDNTIWFLHNQNVAGQPLGKLDRMVGCPLGGAAHISGSTAKSGNQIETVNLVFDLAACDASGNGYAMTYTGAVTMSGTFSGGGPNAVTFSAPSLALAGRLDAGGKTYTVDAPCKVALSDSFANMPGEKGWLHGVVCGEQLTD